MSKIKTCKKCSKEFRLIDMELAFYKKQGYPEPDNCPTCRQKRREALRNPRQFFKRKCDKCGKEIITTHDPKLGRIVYCEKCFAEYYDRVDPLMRSEPKRSGAPMKEELDQKLKKDSPLREIIVSRSLRERKIFSRSRSGRSCARQDESSTKALS